MARKKGNSAEMPSAPSWMLTYGDMTTLLLCFFVLLFALSNIDVAKFSQIIGAFSGSTSFFAGGPTFDDEAINQKKSEATTTEEEKQEKKEQAMEQQARQMEQELADEQLNAEIIRNKRGITIRLSDSLLFDLGNAELKPESRKVLDRVAELL
ncbi:MAG: flagellar motor protein MotB, partial [Candidatus Wallbacteria bacterium]|nr:flagellar motor protein MotB [Candidatus Wallbacteria bacterium]